MALPGAAPRQPEPNQNRGVVLPSGQLDLPRLVDLAAERLKLTIEYDAATLKGSVTLRLAGPISDQELWELTNRILASRGFTTVRGRADGPLSVVKLSDAAAIARLSPEGARPEGPRPGEGQPGAAVAAGFETSVIRVRYRPAKDIVEAVKLVLSKPGGSVSALGDTGLILISDLASRLEQGAALIATLDVPAAEIAVEEVPARFLSPTQLAALAAQIIAKRQAVSGEGTKGEPSRPGFLRGEVLASPAGAAVLVIAPRDSIPAWKELLERLDKREAVETITYAPRSFAASEVGRLVEQVVRDAPGTAGTPGGPGTPGASGAGQADDRWKLVTDELTGTLIVTATASQHERIRALLERLESVPSEARRPVRSFSIRNRPVTQIVDVLNRLIQAGVLGASADAQAASPSLQEPLGRTAPSSSLSPAPPLSTPTLGPATESPSPAGVSNSSGSSAAGPLVPRDRQRAGAPAGDRDAMPLVTLTADEGTNTLIAVGEPRLLAQIEKLLTTLDVRQPQVMLEVMLVSLTQAQTLDLGVELERIFTVNDDTKIRLASLFGLSTAASGARAVGDAAGFAGTVLNPGEFAAIVRALQTVNNGRSLSAPQLLVNNNQQAVISSLLQQPFVSTNASTTVATTSFGGTQDAGTQLTIRPQIAQGDHLVLDYSVTLSSFVGSSGSAALPPPRQQNNVRSSVTIPDGYTVVVGGLDLETDSKSVSQVPFLGDIPLIGEAFKTRNKTRSATKFYVFIRAGVLRSRSFEDLKYLSDLASVKMGIDDGFPEVEPRLIR